MMMRGGRGRGRGGGGGKGRGGGRGGKQVYADIYTQREQTISFSALEYISWVIIYAIKFIDCIYSIIVFIYVLEASSK